MINQNNNVIMIIVENEAGALSRVVGLFSQRGFNIETLNVAPIVSNHSISRITISLFADDSQIEQLTKQLYKIIPVIKVRNLSVPIESDSIENVVLDFALIKVRVREIEEKIELKFFCDTFGAQIAYTDNNCCIVKIADKEQKIKNFIKLLDSKVLETSYSGPLAISIADKIFKI